MIKAILKWCVKVVVLTVMIGVIIVIIGNRSGWSTSIDYSNAFFVAGVFVMAGGLASRLGGSHDVNQFRLLSSTKNFRDKSKQQDLVANTRGSTNLVVLSVLSGVLLILTSVLITKMF